MKTSLKTSQDPDEDESEDESSRRRDESSQRRDESSRVRDETGREVGGTVSIGARSGARGNGSRDAPTMRAEIDDAAVVRRQGEQRASHAAPELTL